MSQFVEVDLPQGRLRGKRITSPANGVSYYGFQGIPFAKPPVGPLRFKPPEDPEPWTGTRDATAEGAISLQFDVFTGKSGGDEDCLFVNVYSPQWPPTSLKAVVVMVHGGAFIAGSGNVDLMGPDYLIAEDVVFVSFNYRVGALGFLYLEGADVTGNNGLRDQVMALKWVKNNITHFGGDPDNVTILGASAGASSVHYLILSPLATGLYHRVIGQGGTALLSSSHTPSDVSSQRAVRLAKVLGCASEEPQLVADFLRTVPAEKILAHQKDALSDEEKDRLLELPFFPTEEIGPDPFLPDSPRKLMSEGRFNKVPFLVGIASAEGKIMLYDFFLSKKLSEVDQRFENVLPPDLVPNVGTETSKEIANKVKTFYFGDKNLDDDTAAQYVEMMSDFMFAYPLHETVKSQVRWSQQPTYVYLFDHVDEPGIISFNTGHDIPGASHGAEMPYLFTSRFILRDFLPGSLQAQMRSTCVQMWTRFVKTGTPSNDTKNFTWTPAEEGKLRYLKVNNGFSMDSDMFKDRMDFVEELYNKYLPQK